MAAGPYLVTRGIVLRDTDTRDADKILTLLTAEQGKIAVIARGARRKGCKFAACAQPLAYSEWTLHKKGLFSALTYGSLLYSRNKRCAFIYPLPAAACGMV